MSTPHFFQETFKYLRRIEPSIYELVEPHLLYLSEEQSQGYLQAMGDESYSGSFHNATVEIIEKHLSEIFPEKLTEISLVDLGPGFPDKTIPIATYLKNRKTNFYYYPVDVSPIYLDLASRHIQKLTRNVFPIQSRFEELLDNLPQLPKGSENFAMIGLTFMNFQSDVILKLLKGLAKENGHIIVATELITQENPVSRIIENYRTPTVERFASGPMRHLGFETNDMEYRPKNLRISG